MTRIYSNILVMLVLGTVSGFASIASADHYQHIDELALQIQNKTNLLLRETSHYTHTPQYQHIVDDARELRRLAAHVHEVAHVNGNIDHLAADLRDLARAHRHLSNLIDRVEHAAAYGQGHVHCDTRHVRALLFDIDNSIGHMRDDVRSLQVIARQQVQIQVPTYHQTNFRQDFNLNRAPVQFGYDGCQGGRSYSNGSNFQFHIRF